MDKEVEKFLRFYNPEHPHQGMSDQATVVWGWPMVECDVTDHDQVFDFLVGRNVDVLINCAGVNNYQQRFDLLREEEAMRVMDVNLWGAVRCTRACLDALKASRGVVCNVISTAAHRPMRYSLAYNVSKAALEMATKQLARELIDDGITVFGVSPNKVAGTAMSKAQEERSAQLRDTARSHQVAHQLTSHLLAREAPTADQVAEFIARLCINADPQLAGCIYQYGGDR